MADQIEIRIPKTRVDEKSAFTATVDFRTRSTQAASTPSTIRYRIDDLTGQVNVRDWTSVSAASQVSISVTADDNAIKGRSNKRERKQIMVQADNGTDGQITRTATWWVTNLYGIT